VTPPAFLPGFLRAVTPVSDRNACVDALKKARVGFPFADFLAELVKKGLAGEELPAAPKSS